MSDDVFLKFEYDERDLVNAMRLRLSGRLRLHVTMVLIVAVGLAVARAAGSSALWHGAAAILLGVVVLAALDACRIAPPKMFDGAFEAKREGADDGESFRDASMSIDASEDGIAVTLGARQANIKWRDCVALAGDARCYVLFHGTAGFLVVPRRAFRTPRRDEVFRELAERSIEAARPSEG